MWKTACSGPWHLEAVLVNGLVRAVGVSRRYEHIRGGDEEQLRVRGILRRRRLLLRLLLRDGRVVLVLRLQDVLQVLLRLLLLLHSRGHGRDRAVDGVEVRQVREVLRVVDGHGLRRVQRPGAEVELGGHLVVEVLSSGVKSNLSGRPSPVRSGAAA